MPKEDKPWPHAPTHRLSLGGTFFVTASTYERSHHFAGPRRLSVLNRGLLKLTADFGWKLEAWAVFSNHYHFVAHSPGDSTEASSLSGLLNELHSKTAIWVNRLDQKAGRQVWFNFRETRLTYPRSYFARLNYVHQNPVSHGLVPVANQYPWCSAAWFERTATPAQIRSIYRFNTEEVKAHDFYSPSPDW